MTAEIGHPERRSVAGRAEGSSHPPRQGGSRARLRDLLRPLARRHGGEKAHIHGRFRRYPRRRTGETRSLRGCVHSGHPAARRLPALGPGRSEAAFHGGTVRLVRRCQPTSTHALALALRAIASTVRSIRMPSSKSISQAGSPRMRPISSRHSMILRSLKPRPWPGAGMNLS